MKKQLVTAIVFGVALFASYMFTKPVLTGVNSGKNFNVNTLKNRLRWIDT